tara:strand:+ start:1972 stop:2229 length:258 start_codon:yes stop_codon:yes gene_type:complete
MKKLIILAAILMTVTGLKAQNATTTKEGNYIALNSLKKENVSKATGKTFTDNKGVVYQVYESIKGKLFYTRISKAGNEYKVYLKL